MVMYYTPHRLYRQIDIPEERDEFGRLKGNVSKEWQPCCRCRCDKNTDSEITTDNGELYRPSWHIAVEGTTTIQAGDIVKIVRIADEEEIAKGKVTSVKRTNYLTNSEIWI